MRGTILKTVCAASAAITARRFASYGVGRGTDLLPWRIKGAGQCHLSVGEHCFIRDKIVFERPNARLSVGDRTYLGNGLIAVAQSVEIGSDVMFGWGVTIVDHNSHGIAFSHRRGDTERWLRGEKDWTNVKIAPVVVGDKAWIGFNATILRGVTVGEGAVVAAGSLVSKSVPPWTVAAGNPARVVRELGPDEQ